MYTKKAHIHFVGIGGIGMSGIATILKYQGYTISGCDADLEQQSIINLKALGCAIFAGNNTEQCHDNSIDILVYSSALKASNPEIVAAQLRGIPTISRALMLAELMRTKYSIAIAGAHGKTTTTSMISHILIETEQDPTVIIGGHLKTISTNARFGKGDFLIAEADESDRSLLRLCPTLAVVTNIDLEHLDVYKDIDDIKNTFLHFLSNIPFYGKAILCTDDPYIRSLLPELAHIKTIKYSFEPDADLYGTDLHLEPSHSTLHVWQKNNRTPLGTLTIPMPGRHNALNALAAVAICLELGLTFESIAEALATFKGVERRFTFKGLTHKNAEIFDDYGHHPTEILATLLVARKRAKNNLIVAFQPHRYSRTAHLWHDFINVFLNSGVNHLVITDIYPASEATIPNITSERFVAELKAHKPNFTIEYMPLDFDKIQGHIKNIEHNNDLILLLGAGKINKLADKLINKL